MKPRDVKFVADFSQRTLSRRQELVPRMLEARQNGKVAYFIGSKLIVKDGKVNQSQRSIDQDESLDTDVTFNLSL